MSNLSIPTPRRTLRHLAYVLQSTLGCNNGNVRDLISQHLQAIGTQYHAAYPPYRFLGVNLSFVSHAIHFVRDLNANPQQASDWQEEAELVEFFKTFTSSSNIKIVAIRVFELAHRLKVLPSEFNKCKKLPLPPTLLPMIVNHLTDCFSDTLQKFRQELTTIPDPLASELIARSDPLYAPADFDSLIQLLAEAIMRLTIANPPEFQSATLIGLFDDFKTQRDVLQAIHPTVHSLPPSLIKSYGRGLDNLSDYLNLHRGEELPLHLKPIILFIQEHLNPCISVDDIKIHASPPFGAALKAALQAFQQHQDAQQVLNMINAEETLALSNSLATTDPVEDLANLIQRTSI